MSLLTSPDSRHPPPEPPSPSTVTLDPCPTPQSPKPPKEALSHRFNDIITSKPKIHCLRSLRRGVSMCVCVCTDVRVDMCVCMPVCVRAAILCLPYHVCVCVRRMGLKRLKFSDYFSLKKNHLNFKRKILLFPPESANGDLCRPQTRASIVEWG